MARETADITGGGALARDAAGAPPTVADVRARGAADLMWQKVEDDLERIDQIDQAAIDEDDDD
jgi:hypothetical protein